MLSLKKSSTGFTIIEVMIVLVIAAVILLIVFLAVPALQRNSRNTQRNNDAGRLNVAFQQYLAAGNPVPTGNIASNATLASELKEEADVRVFDTVQITGYTPTIQNNQPSKDNIQFRSQSVCNDSGNDVDGNTSVGRVALLYWIESGSGDVGKCIQAR